MREVKDNGMKERGEREKGNESSFNCRCSWNRRRCSSPD